MKWELIEGVTLVRRINEAVLDKGYCACLGGSVLYKGGSDKDLDVVMCPMKDTKAPHQLALGAIKDLLNPKHVNVVARIEPEQKLVFSLKTQDDRRIEIFFPNLRYSEVKEDVQYPAFTGKSSLT